MRRVVTIPEPRFVNSCYLVTFFACNHRIMDAWVYMVVRSDVSDLGCAFGKESRRSLN